MSKYFTQQGLELLRTKIADKEGRKKKIGGEVGEAAGDNCDWHDNAPFDDARERLELVSADVRRLQQEVQGAVIVAIQEQTETVAIGTKITISIDEGSLQVYIIGAANESDTSLRLVSYESPVARAVLGHKKGDIVDALIRNKEVSIEILEIEPPSCGYNEVVKKFYASKNQENGVRE